MDDSKVASLFEQIRYDGDRQRRTPASAQNQEWEAERPAVSPSPDLGWYREAHTGPMLSQQRLGEIRWLEAVRNSQRRRDAGAR